MSISTLFEHKKPTLSFEIFPPKRDGDLQSLYKTIEELAQLNPDYISVTYGAAGTEKNENTLNIAHHIKKEYGIESLAHLTCVSNDRKEIDDIFDRYEALGIENILALRGDIPKGLENENRTFQYAGDLIQYIKKTRRFTVGAACYPEGHIESKSKTMDLIHLKNKVDQGADFLVTQLFFDNDRFYDFQTEVRNMGINIPMTVGVMPALNRQQIERMVDLSGAHLPDKFKKVLVRYENNKEALMDAGITYASEQLIDLLSSGVEGVHLYVMNRPEVAKRLVSSVSNILKVLRGNECE